jgi:flagellar hook-length control protein FliK
LESASDTSAAPRSRDGNGGDGIAAAAPPAQAPGSQATAAASADAPADPSQVASILQSGAPSPAGTAAQALTGPAAPAGSAATASPNAAPLAALTGDMTIQALTPAPGPAPASSSATTPAASLAPQATHTSPLAQVAPALMTLATSATGTQRLTLRLDPAELGTVQVRIDRPADAPAHVDIGVSRPETLTLMLRDQTQLQHTLDQAGVPAEGRTIIFHLTGQDADSQSRQGGGFSQSAADGRTASDGQSTRNGAATRGLNDPDDNVKLTLPVPLQWQRAGLDITA